MPQDLIKPDGNAFFVEVPLDYNMPIPPGYEIAELPPSTFLYFNGMPFEDQNDFPIAIGIMNDAVANYPYEQFRWKKDGTDSPNMGLGAETGARMYVAVKKI